MSNDILLEYAKERYENRRIETAYGDGRVSKVYDFKPSDFIDFPTTEEEIIKLLGRKWKISLKLLGSFYDEYKGITLNYLDNPKQGVSILNIGCTNKNLVSIFKNPMNVSRVLKSLVKIKGLVVVDSKFRFGSSTTRFNTSKAYAYNKSVEKLVLKMIQCYSINTMTRGVSWGVLPPLVNTFGFNAEQYFRISVNSKLRIPSCTDTVCRQILEKKYGKLIDSRREKIALMNATLPNEQKICFDWNITRSQSGHITKIGIRATSRLASLKEHDDGLSSYDGLWRQDYLDERYGKRGWFNYDVHGSIFQVNHVLNYGEWLGGADFDPYEVMFGTKFECTEDRKMFKSMCLPIYFESPISLVNHNRLRTPKTYERYGKEILAGVIKYAQSQMDYFTGRRLDSEIFLHESLIYIDFVFKLREMGIDVVQVYDGFYMRIGSVSSEQLDEMMKECAEAYAREYQGWVIAAKEL